MSFYIQSAFSSFAERGGAIPISILKRKIMSKKKRNRSRKSNKPCNEKHAQSSILKWIKCIIIEAINELAKDVIKEIIKLILLSILFQLL